MKMFDKRLELLEAVVVAVKLKNKNIKNNELDFIEFPDIPYVKELIEKININKYPELIDFITDMADCGDYTKLHLYFDENFNFDNTCKVKAFETKDNNNFALLLKKIYFEENIEEIFLKYEDYLNEFEKKYIELYDFDMNEIKNEFKVLFDIPNDFTATHIISLLINGGFSASKGNCVSYIKGIGNKKDVLKEKNEYIIVCLYHEIAHYFVNPIIDQVFKDDIVINEIYEEALLNNLPQTYRNPKIVLYEYFVRAISVIFSKEKVSYKEITDDIEWFKSIGFIRIEEIINFIENGIKENEKIESIVYNYIKYIKSLDNRRIK